MKNAEKKHKKILHNFKYYPAYNEIRNSIKILHNMILLDQKLNKLNYLIISNKYQKIIDNINAFAQNSNNEISQINATKKKLTQDLKKIILMYFKNIDEYTKSFFLFSMSAIKDRKLINIMEQEIQKNINKQKLSASSSSSSDDYDDYDDYHNYDNSDPKNLQYSFNKDFSFPVKKKLKVENEVKPLNRKLDFSKCINFQTNDTKPLEENKKYMQKNKFFSHFSKESKPSAFIKFKTKNKIDMINDDFPLKRTKAKKIFFDTDQNSKLNETNEMNKSKKGNNFFDRAEEYFRSLKDDIPTIEFSNKKYIDHIHTIEENKINIKLAGRMDEENIEHIETDYI